MIPLFKCLSGLALLALLAAAAGCRPGAAPAERSGKLRVVTSFFPVYCLTANVAGDLAEVENLLPPGVGPHDYQFSPRDMRSLASADLMLINGLGIENWLDRALKSAGSRKALTVVELTAGFDHDVLEKSCGIKHLDLPGVEAHKHDHDHDHHHHGPDPHIWLDPRLAAQAVTNILTALQKADPANAAGYAQNAARFIEQLHQLDADIAAALAPLKDKPFITFHGAFGYFVNRYNLKLAGVIEEVPDVNPSPKYLAALLATIRQAGVGVIFTEPQFSPKLAQQIAADLKVKLAQLDTLETGPLKPSAYEEAMRRNVATLVENLK